MALLDAPASGRLGAALPVGIGRRGIQRRDRAGPARRGVHLDQPGRRRRASAPSSPGRSAPRASRVHRHAGSGRADRPDGQGAPRRAAVAGPLLPQRQRGLPAVAGRLDDRAKAIAAADVLHLTGITPALGPGAAGGGRSARCRSPATPGRSCPSTSTTAPPCGPTTRRRRCWPRLAAAADLVFAGPEEAACCSAATPASGPAASRTARTSPAELAKRGPATVVVKLGALGALALSGDEVHRAPRPAGHRRRPRRRRRRLRRRLPERTVVAGGSVPECLRMGNALRRAPSAPPPGDWEGLPTRDELDDLDDL